MCKCLYVVIYFAHHILVQDLEGGEEVDQSNDSGKFPFKRVEWQNGLGVQKRRNLYIRWMLEAPALVEHSFPLKLTHVLLSQSCAPYQVPLNIESGGEVETVSHLHSTSDDSLQPSGTTDARTGSSRSAQARLPAIHLVSMHWQFSLTLTELW